MPEMIILPKKTSQMIYHTTRQLQTFLMNLTSCMQMSLLLLVLGLILIGKVKMLKVMFLAFLENEEGTGRMKC